MKWHKNKKQILKSYSFLSLAANLAIAISVSGLAVLGVLSSSMAFTTLAVSASMLGLVGCLGRFLDQSLDDIKEECDENPS